jgi:hypothetical protein
MRHVGSVFNAYNLLLWMFSLSPFYILRLYRFGFATIKSWNKSRLLPWKQTKRRNCRVMLSLPHWLKLDLGSCYRLFVYLEARSVAKHFSTIPISYLRMTFVLTKNNRRVLLTKIERIPKCSAKKGRLRLCFPKIPWTQCFVRIKKKSCRQMIFVLSTRAFTGKGYHTMFALSFTPHGVQLAAREVPREKKLDGFKKPHKYAVFPCCFHVSKQWCENSNVFSTFIEYMMHRGSPQICQEYSPFQSVRPTRSRQARLYRSFSGQKATFRFGGIQPQK